MTQPTCETCRFWCRGETYVVEAWGSTKARVAWTSHGIQHGQCRKYAPKPDFPETYEFLWCDEHQPKQEPPHDHD